jgi:hypothetical protein
VLVVVAAVEYGVLPRLVDAKSELSLVSDLSVWLLLAAGGFEAMSLVAYTCLTQRLLESDALRSGTQLRIDLTGYGLSHILPGGGAASAAVRYRLMAARGVPEARAASLAGVQAVLAVAGLVVVWAAGSLLSLPRSGSWVTVVLLVAVVGAVALGGGWVTRNGGNGTWRHRVADPLLRRVSMPARGRVTDVVRSAGQTLRDTDALRVGLAWSTANWLLDALCLWLCVRGYGGDVPPELVLAGYGAAMLVGLLPLTPGGVGVVEGLLVPAMVAAGAAGGAAVLGVLTWRLLQFWVPIPIALACWASLGARRGWRRPGALHGRAGASRGTPAH